MIINKLNSDLILKNGLIIDPFNQKSFKGNIWVKNGRIHRVGDFEIPNEKNIKIIDCTNKVIPMVFAIYMFILEILVRMIKRTLTAVRVQLFQEVLQGFVSCRIPSRL